MFALSLLSGGLFIFPVLITVGVFIGAEHQALFSPGGSGKIGSGWFSPGGGGSRITVTTYCQKSYGVTPYPERYVFNPNQWGDPQNTGGLCMNITTDKAVSSKDTFAAAFTATWHYPQGPQSEPVHAFPNAKLLESDSSNLPVQVSTMKSLTLDVSWSYAMGNKVANTTDNDDLEAHMVNANVAIDMFAAESQNKSTSTTESDYEVMVWLGKWGTSTDPIGLATGSQGVETINGTTFNLYYGDNALQQRVFTWLADQNTTEFVGDLSPLVTSLADKTGPSANSYIGYIAFGSEALYSVNNVTFGVPKLELDVVV